MSKRSCALLPRSLGPVRLLSLGLAVSWLIGCVDAPQPNILLVTFDTTRADQIGAFGNERSSTSSIDGLASQGMLFEQAYSTIALTFPSHTTMLTGLYPPAHGIRDNGLFVLGDEVVTLPEILRERGYATGAAIGGFPLVARFNLDQGFDFYDDDLRRKDEDYLGRRRQARSLFFEERPAGAVNEAILGWLEENKDGPFFAWVHYYDPHRPWDPPPPYDGLFADDPYKGEIAYADDSLGVLLDKLREWQVLDGTLVVFTADHGEGLGEHNEETHSMLAYNSTLHVPLVIRPPGGMAPVRVEDPVATVDLAPTMLDYAGIEPGKPQHGYSLKGYAGATDRVPRQRGIYAETLSPRLSHGWGELRALYRGGWKYIHGPRPELFELSEDPLEARDQFASRPEIAETMRLALEEFLISHSEGVATSSVPADAETRAQLQALGYLSGSGETAPIEEILRSDGDAPQDRVIDINLTSELRSHLSAGRAQEAIRILDALLDDDPDNAFYLESLAQARLIDGHVSEAARIMEELSVQDGRGASAEMLLHVGIRLYEEGETERGLRLVRVSADRSPSANTLYQLSTIERRVGDATEVRALLESALEKEPEMARARVDLAIEYVIAGDLDSAGREFERALDDGPFYPKGHFNYGAYLLELGEAEDALARFRRAKELQPDYLAAHLAIVSIELGLGRVDAARRAADELESIAPGTEETKNAKALIADATSS